jgi:hypothetical protein
MAYAFESSQIQTSNELTPIYGKSVYEASGKEDSSFKRGVVIYIGGFNPRNGNDKNFNPRFVYHNYDEKISNQDQLEQAVVSLGRNWKLNAATKRPFPDVFSASLGKVDYGWKPCIVTYILDVYGFEFQIQDQTKNPNSQNQPIVFRRNKIVVTDDGQPILAKFLGNEFGTFSDLKHLTIEGASSLRFYNNMIDENNKVPAQPADPTNSPEREYCMDMYIRTEQGRSLFSFSDTDLESLKKGDKEFLDHVSENRQLPVSQFLAMVFDPPHTNGGGNGPH